MTSAHDIAEIWLWHWDIHVNSKAYILTSTGNAAKAFVRKEAGQKQKGIIMAGMKKPKAREITTEVIPLEPRAR